MSSLTELNFPTFHGSDIISENKGQRANGMAGCKFVYRQTKLSSYSVPFSVLQDSNKFSPAYLWMTKRSCAKSLLLR